MAKEYTEIQLKAKSAGISGWHVKKEATLIADLGALESEVTNDTPIEEKEAPQPHTEPVEAAEEKASSQGDEIKLLKLMIGWTWDQARGNIMMLDKKSKFFEFKDIIEKNWAEERGK